MKSQSVKLGKLCKIQSGGTPRRGVDGFYGGNIPWAKIGDIENANNGYIFKTFETITPAGLKSINNKIFFKNTVLLAMYGSVGKTSIAGLELATNQAILGLYPNDSDILDFKYLRYWLDFSKNNLISKARGVALQNISATIVKEFEIPLPPIEDQKRIVKILDKADALRQKRKQAIGLLDEYLESVFLEMFGDPVKNEKGWEKLTLKQITKKITDGTHQSPGFVENGIPFIFISNIIENEINLNTKKFISNRTYEELTKSTPIEKYDILYTTVGSYGNPAIVKTVDKFCFQRHIAHIKPDNKKTSVYFLYGLLQSPYIKKQADERAKGVAQKTLNLGELNKFEVILPPMSIQNKYADIVEKSENIKQKMLAQYTELETQFQALMQKAFKGEL